MAIGRGIVVIREDGTIAIEDAMEGELAGLAGRYEMLPGPRHFVTLRRLGEKSTEKVVMAGEIISSHSVLEAINVIGNNGWRGDLSIYGLDTFRKLSLAQGALKTAFSQVPNERLGELMVAFGALAPEELAECLRDVSLERRFGEVAIDKGYLSREELFGMLGMQAERIFQNAVVLTEGYFVFTQSEEAPTDTNLHHIPIQALLMESVQRIDEMAHFRERIPSGDLHPQITDKGTRVTVTPSLRPVAELSDGTRSILDISRELREDEFKVTKKIAQLMQVGAVELQSAQQLDPKAVADILEVLNDVLQEIMRTVEAYGDSKEMIWNLQQWTRDSALAEFFGDGMSDEGTVSLEGTLAALEKMEERQLQQLQQAVHQLASFAMFTAGPVIPREAEPQLARRINQRLKALTVMGGARETI